jgi:hypothetical protein
VVSSGVRGRLDGTAEGLEHEARWSVGNRVRGIEPGDRAYMLRQGIHGRGIVAIGEITSEPYSDDSWRDDGGTAQYVDVAWHEAVPLGERIEIHELETEVSGFRWDLVNSSGRDITEYGADLEELWWGQVSGAAPLLPVMRGAGFGTAEQNREVEGAAVNYVTDAYVAEGMAPPPRPTSCPRSIKSASPTTCSRRDTDRALLRQGIEDNLATLGTRRLAAVNLRMMDPSETPGRQFDAQLAALIQAREEGLIDGIGLSNISRRHLLRAVDQTEIVCVQNLFNLADQRSSDVLTECEARNIAGVRGVLKCVGQLASP